jgi:hypothetical protein
MATYLGIPYYAGLGPDGNEVTLFSPGPPADELGFTAADGHWRKQVGVTDLDALWQSRLVGEYRGEPCLVLDDLGDRLHIAYQGRDPIRARQLGYWEIDREVFEVVAARQDVTGLTEERVEYPLDAAMFPASHGDPAAQAWPEVTTRGGAGPQAASAVLPAAAERTGPLRAVPQAGAQPVAEPAGRRELAGYAEARSERSSSALDRMAAWHGSPEAEPWPAPPPVQPAPSVPPPGRRAGRRDRVPQSVFAELLSLAAIPHAAYAVDKDVPGAMCLVKADGGFEVFSRTDDARLDVRFFEDEEAAYFYLFGVLAAEAVRSGRLRPGALNGHVNGSRGPGVRSSSPAETFRSTYGARSDPHQHPVQLSLISRRG